MSALVFTGLEAPPGCLHPSECTTEIGMINKLGGKEWGVSITRKFIKFGGSTEKPLLRIYFGCEAMTWYVESSYSYYVCEFLAGSLVLSGPKKEPSPSLLSLSLCLTVPQYCPLHLHTVKHGYTCLTGLEYLLLFIS